MGYAFSDRAVGTYSNNELKLCPHGVCCVSCVFGSHLKSNVLSSAPFFPKSADVMGGLRMELDSISDNATFLGENLANLGS